VARSIPVPVISVSEDQQVISVYVGAEKHPLEAIPRLLNRANQGLSTLERYKNRLDTVSASLSALEIEDLVTLRDVMTVLQRTEMVRRIAEEIEGHIVELGEDGRLVRLQLDELMGGVEDERRLVLGDYFQEDESWDLDEALRVLASMETDELLDLKASASRLHLPEAAVDLDTGLSPRGLRLLSKVPRLPDDVAGRITANFGSLQKLLRASVEDLEQVEGVDELRARAIKEALARLAETSLLDRYS
jgi:diadenylate cyclase